MKKKTLSELLLEKSVLLDNSENILLEAIEKAEKTIFSKMLRILQGLAQREGRLKRDKLNKSLLRKLEKQILKAIRESTLQKKIEAFVPNFEKVEKLNIAIYENIIGVSLTKKIKEEIGVLKVLQIENIVDDLLAPESLKVNFTNDIRKILFNGIATRQSIPVVEKSLRDLIRGKEGDNGKFKKYIRQVVKDSLNQTDGETQDLIRDAYQLDGFMYVGALVARSRDNCIDLINGKGRFEEFAIERGLYRVEDLPKIIKKARKGKGSGWIEGTNENNFGKNRGGNGCNHQTIYLPLSEEQKQKEIKNTFKE